MKKYVSPSVEEIKLTACEAITGGGSVSGGGEVIASGGRT